ncbi:MAG: TIGR03435 family protein [Bryobacteraceae bacterium]
MSKSRFRLPILKTFLLTVMVAALPAPFLCGLTDGPQDEPKAPPATQFEVATIKPSDPNIPNMRFMFGPGGTFEGAKLTLRFLIEQAYGLRESQVTGGPAWIDSDTFDIKAKADGILDGPENRRVPFQKLLADRFHLSFHKDTTNMTHYALVVTKKGPKFKENTDERSIGRRARGGRGSIDGPSVTIAQLIEAVSFSLERPIIDQTRLTGRYKIKLEWNDEPGPGGATDDPAPSLFTALRDQLGLRLESRKGPVEILVVDQAQKPTAN